MGILSKLIGTINSYFQVGINGPLINANAGALEAKNADGSVLTVFRAANPVGSTDVVNLSTLQNVVVATATTASFVQPAVGANVAVAVGTTANLSANQNVFCSTGGYYSVYSITDGTDLVLTNLGTTGNAVVGSTVPSASRLWAAGAIGPSGPQGAQGAQGATGAPGPASLTSATVLIDTAGVTAWTLPANALPLMFVQIQGAGGGGAGGYGGAAGQNNPGGGGGGTPPLQTVTLIGVPSHTYKVTVGAGGLAGTGGAANTAGTDGSRGSRSSIVDSAGGGNLFYAYGGAGGLAAPSQTAQGPGGNKFGGNNGQQPAPLDTFFTDASSSIWVIHDVGNGYSGQFATFASSGVQGPYTPVAFGFAPQQGAICGSCISGGGGGGGAGAWYTVVSGVATTYPSGGNGGASGSPGNMGTAASPGQGGPGGGGGGGASQVGGNGQPGGNAIFWITYYVAA